MTTSMQKTPISLLQEMMVRGGHAFPVYTLIESCPAVFKYRVDVKNITAFGSASTKQRAKQESAKSALEVLGYIKDNMELDNNCNMVSKSPISVTSVVNRGAISNYVGMLNEFASKNALGYPIYKEDGFNNGFVVRCTFYNLETSGVCTTKKNAKQKAAELMFKRVEKDLSILKTPDNISVCKTTLPIDNEKIVKVFSELSVSNKHNLISQNSNSVFIPKTFWNTERLNINTVEACIKEFERLNVSYTYDVFQDHPLILVLEIKSTDQTILVHGESYDVTLLKLLQRGLCFYKTLKGL